MYSVPRDVALPSLDTRHCSQRREPDNVRESSEPDNIRNLLSRYAKRRRSQKKALGSIPPRPALAQSNPRSKLRIQEAI